MLTLIMWHILHPLITLMRVELTKPAIIKQLGTILPETTLLTIQMGIILMVKATVIRLMGTLLMVIKQRVIKLKPLKKMIVTN